MRPSRPFPRAEPLLTRLLAVLAGLGCLGAAEPESGAVPPFFSDVYETAQVAAHGYAQRYHEGILITGTAEDIARVREALELVASVDPSNWYFVRKHIRRITCNGHSGMDVGGGRLTTAGRADEPVTSLAGRIVHDAWHRERYVRGQSWQGPAAEAFCLIKQNEFLARVGWPPLHLPGTLRSGFWQVDYWARDW